MEDSATLREWACDVWSLISISSYVRKVGSSTVFTLMAIDVLKEQS